MFFLFPLRTDRWNGSLPLGTLVLAVLLVAGLVAQAAFRVSEVGRVAEKHGMSAQAMQLTLAGERAMQAVGMDEDAMEEGLGTGAGADPEDLKAEVAAAKESNRFAFVPSEGRISALLAAPWFCGGLMPLVWTLLALWLFGTSLESEFGTLRAFAALVAGQALTWALLFAVCLLFSREALDAAWYGPAAGVAALNGFYVGRFPKSRVKWWLGWWFLKFKAVRFTTPAWAFALFWALLFLDCMPPYCAFAGTALGAVCGALSAKLLPAKETREDLSLTGDEETDERSLERLEANARLTSRSMERAWKFMEDNRFEQAGILIMRQVDEWIADPSANAEALHHLLRKMQNQILNPKVLCVPTERVMEWARTLAKLQGWEPEVLYLLGWISGSSTPESATWRQAKLAEAMVRLRTGAMPSMAADILRELAKTDDACGKRAAELLARIPHAKP